MVTPNLREAEALLQLPAGAIGSLEDMKGAARKLLALGPRQVSKFPCGMGCEDPSLRGAKSQVRSHALKRPEGSGTTQCIRNYAVRTAHQQCEEECMP